MSNKLSCEAATRCRSDLRLIFRCDHIDTSQAKISMSTYLPCLSAWKRHFITLVLLVFLAVSSCHGTEVNSNSATVASGGRPDLNSTESSVTSSSTTQRTASENVTVTSVFSTAVSAPTTATTTTVGSNPVEINGSAKINNSGLSTGIGDQRYHNHSDLISHLHCEYGIVRKYSFISVVRTRLLPNATTRATIILRCLHQVTWGIGEQQDKLNGQKYLAYISDFHSDARESENSLKKRRGVKERYKRGVYQYLEHVWSDFKSILPFEEEEKSAHDDFDQDLLRSMENELRSKCHSMLFWEEFRSLQQQGLDKCIHCHTNPLSKFSLPFWFIQLEDGSIPQIRFTKQETNLDVTNFKKFIVSLLATQLNSSRFDAVEMSVLGVHHSHYRVLNHTESNISHDQTVIERHITTPDFIIEQTKELQFTVDKLPLQFNATQLQQIDLNSNQITASSGTLESIFGPSELSPYSTTINEHRLQREDVTSNKVAEILNEMQESYIEGGKETLVAEPIREENLLHEKFRDSLYRLRSRLSHNEYHYYTKLFECATHSPSQEYNNLLRLVGLEQQLNHTIHQHNSLIGDLRRIGTIHNIQIVCGSNLAKLTISEPCSNFLSLLLQSSSKTAQHILMYSVQNQSALPNEKATLAARLLAQTYQPSRWLVENLAHEAHHYASNRAMETIILQTLTQLAQHAQLSKLKELLSVHLVKRLRDTMHESVSPESEFYTIDLIEMLGNINNYTALRSVQDDLEAKWPTSDLVIITTIQAYRRSINRSQIQSQLGQLFLRAHSCQIKQQIVLLLIDNVDQLFWQRVKDKQWPKYGFQPLDHILAEELRNASTNCVHHLIIEYLKRKENSLARKLVAEFEASKNYNASSFDFCINGRLNYQCDYVQTLSNEMASVEMRKSISISKPLLDSSALLANSRSKGQQPQQYSYTRHSLTALIYKHKLTVAHLSLIQMRGTGGGNQLRVQLQTHRGLSIPLANLELSKQSLQNSNGTTVKIAQMKLTVPVKVACAEHVMQADNALLVQMDTTLALRLQQSTDEVCCNRSVPQLHLQISLQLTGELLYAGLAMQRSIDLQTKFEYLSKQPLEIWLTKPAKEEKQTNVSTSQRGNNLIRLGKEKFYGEIELWHHSNKHYDAQCNIWMDQTARQQLSHWNCTIKQSNLLSLPIQFQPLMPTMPTTTTAIAEPTNTNRNEVA